MKTYILREPNLSSHKATAASHGLALLPSTKGWAVRSSVKTTPSSLSAWMCTPSPSRFPSPRVIPPHDDVLKLAKKLAATHPGTELRFGYEAGPHGYPLGLQHVLPRGLQRVRHFGWLSAAAKERFARVRALLDWQPPPAVPPPAVYVPRCPCCQKPMQLMGRLARPPPWQRCG